MMLVARLVSEQQKTLDVLVNERKAHTKYPTVANLRGPVGLIPCQPSPPATRSSLHVSRCRGSEGESLFFFFFCFGYL